MVSTTVCHSPAKTPSFLHVSIHPPLTSEMSCGSCTLSCLLWWLGLLTQIQPVHKRRLLSLDERFLFCFTATMDPVKRPIMCTSILCKTDNWSTLGNMQKRTSDRVGEKKRWQWQELCMFVCVRECVFNNVQSTVWKDQPQRRRSHMTNDCSVVWKFTKTFEI